MRINYQRLSEKLRPQLRLCRDREVRIKAELLLLGAKLENVTEACARRGFSRKFFYKWLRRLRRSGYQLDSLLEKSRRPRKSPKRIKKELEDKIFSLNRRGCGGRMIKAYLQREKQERVSTSTICHVLNHRRKQRKTRRVLAKAHRRRYEMPIPGQRIQLDVKYVPEFVNGERVFAYVAVDECTRWRFAYGYASLNAQTTLDFLERLRRCCPFPIASIQTDNGQEFTYRLLSGERNYEHLMDTWCQTHKIYHRMIPPGEKELNGKVERSHRIDEQYFYWRAPTTSLEKFNKSFAQWINYYNHKRPHGGIGYQTPWEKLAECLRELPKTDVEENLRALKLRFLQEAPKRLLPVTGQLEHYDFRIKPLKMAA